MKTFELTIQDILNAYANGLFPMADSGEDDKTYWVDPPMRGQLPIADLHIPSRLQSTVKQFPFEVTHDTAFKQVIEMCAAPAKGRQTTWINEEIKQIFIALHETGFAHSVECWSKPDNESQNSESDQNHTKNDSDEKELVGGIYGLAIGGLFCAESKFHTQTDASKIALVHLTARLWKGGYRILDTQFTNKHLEQFGIYEIPKNEYLERVKKSIYLETDFNLKNITEQELIEEYLAQNALKQAKAGK